MGRVQEVAWTEALEALDLSQAADVENAYELMKQWRDANPNDEAVQMFSAELALNLGRYRRPQTVSQRLVSLIRWTGS